MHTALLLGFVSLKVPTASRTTAVLYSSQIEPPSCYVLDISELPAVDTEALDLNWFEKLEHPMLVISHFCFIFFGAACSALVRSCQFPRISQAYDSDTDEVLLAFFNGAELAEFRWPSDAFDWSSLLEKDDGVFCCDTTIIEGLGKRRAEQPQSLTSSEGDSRPKTLEPESIEQAETLSRPRRASFEDYIEEASVEARRKRKPRPQRGAVGPPRRHGVIADEGGRMESYFKMRNALEDASYTWRRRG